MLNALFITARALQFAAILLWCGSAVWLAGARGPDVPYRLPRRYLPALTLSALLASLLTLAAQSALLADSGSLLDLDALRGVITDTRFGRIGALRCLLLAAASALALRRWPKSRSLPAQALLAACISATLAWTGHGAHDAGVDGALHLGADVLHLWAAALWLGALPPLLMLLGEARASASAPLARNAAAELARFSPLGLGAVTVLAVTGLINSAYLIGPSRWRALFAAPYGRWLLLKLSLFAVMLLLAAANRFRLVPRLQTVLEAAEPRREALERLRRSLISETLLGLAVLAVVAWLGTLSPPVSD